MLGVGESNHWHWVGFILCVLVFLTLDLGLFHRKAHVVTFKEALGWTTVWFAVAALFGLGLWYFRGKQEAVVFATGYFIEVSLSMDNVFVIALIFAYFRVQSEYQHRVLFWGILGALVMRGVMIAAGGALVSSVTFVLYAFVAVLFFSRLLMMFAAGAGVRRGK